MASGLCKLCGKKPAIKNSHLIPKFVYKRYVSNRDKGGSYVDLKDLIRVNRHLVRNWFCTTCEALFAEKYAADVLKELDNGRVGLRYTGELLRFAASSTYRICLRELTEGQGGPGADAIMRRVRTKWGNFLLGKETTVEPYTLHAHVIEEMDSPWAGRVGSEVSFVNNLVICQMGPLIIFGMLKEMKNALAFDKWALQTSKLLGTGGVLGTISQKSKNYNLTDDMADQLNHAERWCIERAKAYDAAEESRRKFG